MAPLQVPTQHPALALLRLSAPDTRFYQDLPYQWWQEQGRLLESTLQLLCPLPSLGTQNLRPVSPGVGNPWHMYPGHPTTPMADNANQWLSLGALLN